MGYTANEPIQLRARGIPVTEMRVSDYVQLASNGILASEKVIRENPELVRAFVGAFLKGLADTIANPDEAYQLSESYIPNFADLDKDVQKQVLQTSIEAMEDRPTWVIPIRKPGRTCRMSCWRWV